MNGIKSSDFLACYQKAKSAKLVREQVWSICQRYVRGDQTMISKDAPVDAQMLRTRRKRGNDLSVNELIQPYRHLYSKLQINYPGITVMPSTPSSDDIAKAKASELTGRFWWNQVKLEHLALQWLADLVTIGTAVWHCFPSDREEVSLKVVSPYDLFIDPDACTLDDLQWVAIRYFASKEELSQMYPDVSLSSATLTSRKQSRQEAGDTGLLVFESANNDKYEYIEVYYSDGRHCCYILGISTPVLEEQYDPRIRPISIARYTVLSGDVLGIGAIEPAVDIQTMLNKFTNQHLDNIELMGNPHLLVARSSGVTAEQLQGYPGRVLKYQAGSPVPQPIPPPTMSPANVDIIRHFQSKIYDSMGIHSTTLGRRAVGIDSGVAIQAITQNDVSQLQMTMAEIERSITEVITAMLTYASSWTEGKYIRMFEGAGKYIHQLVRGTDLVKDPEVIIESGSLFRDTAESRDQKTLDLLKLGILTPDQARERILVHQQEKADIEKLAYVQHATLILDAAKQGLPIEIFAYDPLNIFKDVFGDYIRINPEYYRLPPNVQEYIRDIYIAVSAPPPPPGSPGASLPVFPPAPPGLGEVPGAPTAQSLAPTPSAPTGSRAQPQAQAAPPVMQNPLAPPAIEKDVDSRPGRPSVEV